MRYPEPCAQWTTCQVPARYDVWTGQFKETNRSSFCEICQDLCPKFTFLLKNTQGTESPDVQRQLRNLLPHGDHFKTSVLLFWNVWNKSDRPRNLAEVLIKLLQERLPAFLPGTTIAPFFFDKSEVQTHRARPHQPPVLQIKPSSCSWSVRREEEVKTNFQWAPQLSDGIQLTPHACNANNEALFSGWRSRMLCGCLLLRQALESTVWTRDAFRTHGNVTLHLIFWYHYLC